MGPFSGDTPTVTRSNKGTNDSAAPDFGNLNPKAMTTPGGLSGCTGTDAKLIHGDRWQQIDGMQTETINKDLNTHILKTETWTIDEDLKLTVNGKTTDNRIEDVKEYFHAESRFEYFGEHTDQHHEHDFKLNPTVGFDILHTEGEYKNIDLAIKSLVLEAKGGVIDVTVGKAEAWAAGAEAFGASVAAGFFSNEAVHIDVGEKEMEGKLRGIHGDITALNSQVGATRTIIMPVRVGICIAVHMDSPWA